MLSSLRSKVTKRTRIRKIIKDPFVIPLIPVPSQAVGNSETITFKLWIQPKDTKSQTYKMTACVFTMCTPEEWSQQHDNMFKVFPGKAITTGRDQFAMSRRLLKDKALTDFEASFTKNAYT